MANWSGIRRDKEKKLTPIDGEENQEINGISAIEERTPNESGPMESSGTDIHVHVETKIADEERLFIDELKALMIQNETEEYLTFNKVDQRKLMNVTKKVNAVIGHIETWCNSNKQTYYDCSPLGCKRSWSHGRKEQLKVILPAWERISTDSKGKDEKKLEGKERETLRD